MKDCLALDLKDRSKKLLVELGLEGPVGEDDPDAMIEFTERFGDQVQIIGDDYLVTNSELVDAAIKADACNAVLVKVNQIGTVS